MTKMNNQPQDQTSLPTDESVRPYVHGSPLKHILKLSFFIGMNMGMVFVAALYDLYLLGQLSNVNIIAAFGFCGVLTMISFAFSASASMSSGILVSRFLGALKEERAKQIATFGMMFTFIFVLIPTLIMRLFLTSILLALGAEGAVLELAKDYSNITLIFSFSLGLLFTSQAILRARKDLRESLWVTLSSTFAIFIFSPIFILYFGWGIKGSAWSYSISYLLSSGLGIYFLFAKKRLVLWIPKAHLRQFSKDMLMLVLPNFLSQMVQNSSRFLSLWGVSYFGTAAVAAMTVLNQIFPLLFVGIISMIGAVSPVMSQNYGAKKYDRVVRTFWDAVVYTLIYCVPAGFLFVLSGYYAAPWFGLSDEAQNYLINFNWIYLLSASFIGINFIITAVFSTTERPWFAMVFNVMRVFVFMLPFVALARFLAPSAEWVVLALSLSFVFAAIFGMMYGYFYFQKRFLKPTTERLV